jgi:hypothetical protein
MAPQWRVYDYSVTLGHFTDTFARTVLPPIPQDSCRCSFWSRASGLS